MRIHIDPPLAHWRVEQTADTDRRELAALAKRTDENAPPALDTDRPIVATGHQPWLWHPGILVKDLAAANSAQRAGASTLHLVVDHDVLDPLRLELPVNENGALRVETVKLGAANAALPACAQPAVDADTAVRALDEARRRLGDALAADVQPIIDAIAQDREVAHDSLAAQVAAWTARLMWPYTGDIPFLPTSALLATTHGQHIIRAMLHDARRCVRCYNEAVAQTPEAGVPMLLAERERVELPLWSLRWNAPRQRVFADLADTTPLLTLEDGTPLDEQSRWLAPRALMLTALMRSAFCEMFIHGKGGGVYDRIAEAWWQSWRGQTLAPMAVATADAHLELDAPIATHDDLHRAQWYRHHAPYNVDRLLGLNGPAVTQKRRLLRQMGQTRDRWRRWLAFRELRRFNGELERAHPEVLADAEERLRTARVGLANGRVAAKRDWCFALYPPATLRALHDALERPAAVCACGPGQGGRSHSV